jgi:subtilase family protein
MGGRTKRSVDERPMPFGRTLLAAIAASALFPAMVPHAEAANDWRSRVAPKLLSAYDARVHAAATATASPPATTAPATAAPTAPTSSAPTPTAPRFDASGRVQADAYFDCSLPAPTSELTAAGFTVSSSVKIASLCVVEGWTAPGSLPKIVAVPGVTRVSVPAYVTQRHPMPGATGSRGGTSLSVNPSAAPTSPSTASTSTSTPRPSSKASVQLKATAGGIDANGVSIMRAGQFVSQTGTGGAGVMVGVQSIGVSNLSVIQARNELPQVSTFTPAGSANPAGDEGTALLEEVHAVAPAARLAFCGPQTFVDYTSCLNQMIAAGATVLVDDVLFFQQDPMTSDSTYTQAINQILTQNPNVAIFTDAGNDNGSYWEGTYTPVSIASNPLTCPTAGSTQNNTFAAQFGDGASAVPYQVVTVTSPGDYPLTFAWNDPVGQNASNFEVYWTFTGVSAYPEAQSGCFSTTASMSTLVVTDAVLDVGTYNFYIATPDASLAGKFLKLWVGGDGVTTLTPSTPGSVVSPQAFATGIITVGAVNGSDGVGNNIEAFSSRGPITVYFPTQAKLQAPTLVAPDGINVDASGTYFQNFLFPDGNFYGTSAAAPNAAGVAALLRGAFPNLTVPQMLSALEGGAAQLGSTVPDDTFGYGRVDAVGALGTIALPTITAISDIAIDAAASSTGSQFTVTGIGTLHFAVASTNTTLVPSTVGAAGQPGVSVSPSTCGGDTLTCTLTVTPAPGEGGTTSLTFSVLDGANRPAPATLNVTVTHPVGMVVVVGTGGSSSTGSTGTGAGGGGGGGGGALGAAEIGLLAALAGWALRRSRPYRVEDRTRA